MDQRLQAVPSSVATDLVLAHIDAARAAIDPVFLDSPQFVEGQLCAALGREVLLKVETANPLRSFKGRGVDFLLSQLGPCQHLVCASTGNFGQALAYAAQRRGIAVDVFMPAQANALKAARTRAFGARVTTVGADSSACGQAARAFAEATPGSLFVKDGQHPAIAEGAGTIGIELLARGDRIDTVVLPVGDGALIAGVACWLKAHAPQTRVVGVCASGAPSMALSWRAGRTQTTERSQTIAEGIEVRNPVADSVRRLVALVDEMVLVDDEDLLQAMRLIAQTTGLLAEPAGAAGVAAIRRHPIRGERLATVLTGSNLRADHAQWLFGLADDATTDGG